MTWNHPEIPTCSDCRQWWYDPKDWKRMQRAGEDLPRPTGAPTPCWKCPKAKDGKPNPDADLTDRSYRAMAVYYQIKAGMPMPPDPVVAWYCGLIRYTEDAAARARDGLMAALLASLPIRPQSRG